MPFEALSLEAVKKKSHHYFDDILKALVCFKQTRPCVIRLYVCMKAKVFISVAKDSSQWWREKLLLQHPVCDDKKSVLLVSRR